MRTDRSTGGILDPKQASEYLSSKDMVLTPETFYNFYPDDWSNHWESASNLQHDEEEVDEGEEEEEVDENEDEEADALADGRRRRPGLY